MNCVFFEASFVLSICSNSLAVVLNWKTHYFPSPHSQKYSLADNFVLKAKRIFFLMEWCGIYCMKEVLCFFQKKLILLQFMIHKVIIPMEYEIYLPKYCFRDPLQDAMVCSAWGTLSSLSPLTNSFLSFKVPLKYQYILTLGVLFYLIFSVQKKF